MPGRLQMLKLTILGDVERARDAAAKRRITLINPRLSNGGTETYADANPAVLSQVEHWFREEVGVPPLPPGTLVMYYRF